METNQGVVAARTVGKGAEAWMADSIGIQRGDPEEGDNDIAVTESAPNPKPPAASTNEKPTGIRVINRSSSNASSKLPSHPVGRGVLLPFNQTLPRCRSCCSSALITRTRRSDPTNTGFVCLDHGLKGTSVTRDLVLLQAKRNLFTFISPQHEAAIRAFLG